MFAERNLMFSIFLSSSSFLIALLLQVVKLQSGIKYGQEDFVSAKV